jgi:hypothetical protein
MSKIEQWQTVTLYRDGLGIQFYQVWTLLRNFFKNFNIFNLKIKYYIQKFFELFSYPHLEFTS